MEKIKTKKKYNNKYNAVKYQNKTIDTRVNNVESSIILVN